MRNQVLSVVALSIALAISPTASFAKGGGGGGGGGGSGGSSHSSTGTGAGNGSKTPFVTGGHPYGGYHPKPSPGNGNKAGSKPVNCKSGGEGCYHQQ
jgi:hypothetical protein